MRYIQKGEEPESLLQYRRNKDAYYDGYSQKDDVRESLLKEQGYLCGYCMRRLQNCADTKIEHIIPQSKLREDQRAALDYKIMIGVCYGNEKRGNSKKTLTCDAHRGNINLTVNPFDQNCISKIFYKSDGTIDSTDDDIKEDIQNTLNLNYDGTDVYLKKNRREVLLACKAKMKHLQESGNWNKALLKKMLKEYEEPDSEGKLKPYSGIAIWYLKKRLKNST